MNELPTDFYDENGKNMTVKELSEKLRITEKQAAIVVVLDSSINYLLAKVSTYFGIQWYYKNAPETFLEFLKEIIIPNIKERNGSPYFEPSHDIMETTLRETEAYIKNPKLKKAEGVVKIQACQALKLNPIIKIETKDEILEEDVPMTLQVKNLLKGRPKAYYFYRLTKAGKMDFMQEALYRIW